MNESPAWKTHQLTNTNPPTSRDAVYSAVAEWTKTRQANELAASEFQSQDSEMEATAEKAADGRRNIATQLGLRWLQLVAELVGF